MSTIGFIGLGNMGFPMASRLADAGHRLIVNDRDQGAVQRFQDEHPDARTAAGRPGLAGADIIITMLPNSDIVEGVLTAAESPRPRP